MNRFKLTFIGVAAVLFGAVGVASTASAGAVYIAQENGTSAISRDTTVDGSAYLAGPSVRVSGTVNGDVYCAGNSITIDGTVTGDVLCAGNTITVDGTVEGDVRLAGAMVQLSGTVEGNASIFAADARIDDSAKVAGDLNGSAGTLTIDGIIGRDMAMNAGALTLNGMIGRDVMANLGGVTFGDDASVVGSFAYAADTELTIPEGVVGGETTFTQMTQPKSSSVQQAKFAWMFFIGIVSVAILVMLGTAVIPRYVHRAGDVSWSRFGLAAVVGLTFVIVTPTIALLLAITGIGMYAAYVVFILWLLVMAAAPIPFAYFVGTKLYGSRSNNVLMRATAGALALMIALVLPVLNIFVFLFMITVGAGLFLLRAPSLYEGNPYVVTNAKKKKTA